jgi:hypothetical protein
VQRSQTPSAKRTPCADETLLCTDRPTLVQSRWHTHGDVLAASCEVEGVPGLIPGSAASRFIAEILGDRVVMRQTDKVLLTLGHDPRRRAKRGAVGLMPMVWSCPGFVDTLPLSRRRFPMPKSRPDLPPKT